MIKVLIVDDSALVRQVLTRILEEAPDIQVVGAARDPFEAREKIKQLNPDVLTLDVEMPRMDGVTFLSNLMRLRPMPVVMVSTLTEKGADVTFRALELGAVDFVTKPRIDVQAGLSAYTDELLEKVRAAALAKVSAIDLGTAKQVVGSDVSAGGGSTARGGALNLKTTDTVIGIGSSTGGTEAVKALLSRLPPDTPGIVISQHIPVAFSRPFAARVNKESALVVSEASDGQQILPGHAYIAPGDRHLRVERNGARYLCRLDDGEPVNRHKPSVEVMCLSLARNVGKNAVGIMLTGMGADGADAMGEMQAAGAPIIAQDERSSVVWGMPGAVVKRGFADHVVSLDKMAEHLLDVLKTRA